VLNPALVPPGVTFPDFVMGQLSNKLGDIVFDDEELATRLRKESRITINLWNHIRETYDVYSKFSGVLVIGIEYGKMAIIFDPKALTPVSFSTVSGAASGWSEKTLPDDISIRKSQRYVAEQYAEKFPALFFEEHMEEEYSDLKDLAVKTILEVAPRKFFELEVYKRPDFQGPGRVGEDVAKKIAEDEPKFFLDKGLGSYYTSLEFIAAKALAKSDPGLLAKKYEYLVDTYGDSIFQAN
jgi:hypothetical protein